MVGRCAVCGCSAGPQLPVSPVLKEAADLLDLKLAPRQLGCCRCVALLHVFGRFRARVKRHHQDAPNFSSSDSDDDYDDAPPLKKKTSLPLKFQIQTQPVKKSKPLPKKIINNRFIKNDKDVAFDNAFDIFSLKKTVPDKKSTKNEELLQCSRDIFESEDDLMNDMAQSDELEDEDFNLTPTFDIISNLHK